PAALVGVADGVGNAGVGYAGHKVHLGHLSPGGFVPGHDGPVAVAHNLYIDPLIVGVGVTVVGPQEGADLHLLAGGGEGLKAVGGDADNFLGAQLIGVVIAQLVIGEGLKGHTAAPHFLPDEDRQPPQLVPGGDDLTLLGEDE